MTTQRFSVRHTFDIDAPDGIEVLGKAQASAFTPALDTNYKFRKSVVSDVLAWLQFSDEPLYITGPTGSGKSSLVCQVAARLNLSVQRVTAHSRLEAPELIGHHTLVDGDMMFVDGPLTTAMRYGQLFLLDEIDLLDPATAAGLNGILEGDPLVIPENGGELVKPADGFRFVATGNTAGGGDRNGMYQGTMRQNMAFMDRFWIMEVGYPEQSDEELILEKTAPGLPQVVRGPLVEIANTIREAFMGDGRGDAPPLDVTMSTRTLVRWAQMIAMFRGLSRQGINPVSHALDRALAYKASPETREALHEIVQRHLGDGAIS